MALTRLWSGIILLVTHEPLAPVQVKGQKELVEAVEATKETEIFERSIYYRKPLARYGMSKTQVSGWRSPWPSPSPSTFPSACSWSSPLHRVILVGDAAHGMHPRSAPLSEGPHL